MNFNVCDSNYWKPDMFIGMIYKHWNRVINKLIINSSFKEMNIDNNAMLHKYPFLFDTKYLTTFINDNDIDNNEFSSKSNEKCIFIYINYILQSLQFTQHVSSILVGIEMLTHFSKKLPDLMKLQHIILYLVYLLSMNDNLTLLTSLQYLLDILTPLNFNELILPESEYLIFHSYIFLAVLNLYYKVKTALVLQFISIIDVLIALEEKFSEVILRLKIQHKVL